MNDLPPGWAPSTLGQLGRYINGRGFKKSEWGTSGRPIIRIQNLTGSSSKFNYFDGEVEDGHVVAQGDLLVSWAATLGAFVWRGPEGLLNQHIFKVNSYIDHGFHRYLVEFVLDDLMRQTHGSGMVHITKNRFDSTPVALPPVAEQRRIVAAIEEQLSRLDAAEASLRRAQDKSTAMGSAILDALLTGWPRQRIGEIAKVYVGATPSRARPDLWNGDIPWVSSGEVAFCRIRSTRETISASALARNDRLHPPGTVLLAMIGEGRTRGQAAILDLAAAHNQNSAAIRLDPAESTAEWLFYALMARYEQTRIESSGNNQPALNKSRVEALTIPLPPLEEQRRIVAEVERQLSILDATKAAIESALERSKALRRAILERAFAGKLVPQDPADEPASVLLERIAAERAMAGKADGRRRRPVRP